MTGLCKYNIAYIDVIFTVIMAWAISKLFAVSFGYTLVVVFLLGIVMHRAFCVRTTIDKLIFG